MSAFLAFFGLFPDLHIERRCDAHSNDSPTLFQEMDLDVMPQDDDITLAHVHHQA